MRRAIGFLAFALALFCCHVPAYAQQIVSGGGGSSGISSVTAGAGLAATAGTCNTGSGSTLSACQKVITKTANYTLVSTDGFSNFNFNSAGGGTFTIPQAGGAGFEAGVWFCFTSQSGAMTLTPTTSTLYGSGLSSAGSVIVGSGLSACIGSDGTNYTFYGPPGGAVAIPGILTLQSGLVETVRTVTAAGVVTVATSDLHVCINKASGAATTANLPSSPTTGQRFSIDDCKGDAATNNITVTPASGNIDGSATFVINSNWGSWSGYYNGAAWKTVASR